MSFLSRIGAITSGLGGALEAPVGLVYDLAKAPFVDDGESGFIHTLWDRTTNRGAQVLDYMFSPNDSFVGSTVGAVPGVVRNPVGDVVHPILNGNQWLYTNAISHPLATLLTVGSLTESQLWRQSQGGENQWGVFFDPDSWGKAWDLTQHQSAGQALAINLNFAFGPNFGIGKHKDILDQGEINKFEGSDFYHVASGITDLLARQYDPLAMAAGGIPGVENIPGVSEKGFLAEGLVGGTRQLIKGAYAPEVEAVRAAAIKENFFRGMTAEQRAAGIEAVRQAAEEAKSGLIDNYLRSGRWDKLNKAIADIRDTSPDLNTATGRIAKELFGKHPLAYDIAANMAQATTDNERAWTMRVLMGENNALYQLQDNVALREALRGRFEEQSMIKSTAYDDVLHQSSPFRPDVDPQGAVQQTLDDIGKEQYDNSPDAIRNRLQDVAGRIDHAVQAPTGLNPLIPVKNSEFYQQSAWTKPVRMFFNARPTGYINFDDPNAITQMDRMLRDAGMTTQERAPWYGKFANAAAEERPGIVLDAEQAALRKIGDRFGVTPEAMDQFRSVANIQRQNAMDVLRNAARDEQGRSVITLPGLDETAQYRVRLADSGNDLLVPDMKKVAAQFGKMEKLGINKALTPVNEILNSTMKLWRPGTLLRPAWPIRIIGDHSLVILAKMNELADGSSALRQRIADYATFHDALQNYYVHASKEFGLGWGTTGGAAIGAVVGGPVGAAIGGAAGLGLQLLGRQLEENPYLQLGINGHTVQGALGNESDKIEINKALVSSQRDYDMGIGRLAPGRANPFPANPADATTLMPGTPGYAARWEQIVNDELGKDPIAKMILAHDHLPEGAWGRYSASDVRNWVQEHTVPAEGENIAAKGVIPYVYEGDSLNRDYDAALHGAIRDSVGKDYSIEHIDPKSIVTIQGRVEDTPLHQYIAAKSPDAVTVVKTGDKYYLWDGNHRLTSALARGDESILAQVHDFKPTAGMSETRAEMFAQEAANDHVYPEPLTARTGADVAKTWLTSNRDGKLYAQGNPVRAQNIDNWVNSVSELAHDLTARDPELANKLASGRPVTIRDLEDAVKRQTGTDTLNLSDMPTLHFEHAVQTMGRKSIAVRGIQSTVEKLYKLFGTMPLDDMINQRFNALVYSAEMEKSLSGVLPSMTTELPDLAKAAQIVDKELPDNFFNAYFHPRTGAENAGMAESPLTHLSGDMPWMDDVMTDINRNFRPEDFVTKKVPMRDIISEQGAVFPDIVKDYLEIMPDHGEATALDMGNGQHLLIDGNHRATAAFVRGDPYINMNVLDMRKLYSEEELQMMRADMESARIDATPLSQVPRKVVNFSDETMRAMENSARRVALHNMRKTMYDYAERSEFADMMRHVMPFFPAWQQTMQRWAGIALENPEFIRRAQQVMEAPGKMGATWKDPDTGEEYVRFRLPEFAKGLLGHGVLQGALDDQGYIKFQMKGLTPALGAPGFGPWVDIALKPFVDQRPELEDSLKLIYPYGMPQNAIQAFMPPNIQNVVETQTDSGRSYRSAYNRILITRLVKMQTGELPTLDLNNEKARAEFLAQVGKEAHQFSAFRFVMGLTSPVSGLQYDSPYQPLIDKYRELQKTDPEHAQDKFLDEFGDDFFALTQAFTKVNNGVPASVQGQKAYEKHQALIQQFPELGSLILGSEGGGSAVQFSNAAYQKQLSTPLRPGSDVMQRSYLSPEEIIQQDDQRLGWIKFTRAMDLIDAEMSNRGINNINDKKANDLRALKDLLTNKIAGEHPQWFADYQNRDETKWDNRIASMKAIVKDPTLSQRPDIEALKGYLDARDAMVAMLSTRPTTGIEARGNADLSFLWNAYIQRMKAGPGGLTFSNLFNRWLINDPLNQTGPNTLGLPQEAA